MALTVHGLGGFPSEHFLCLQMLGMHGTVYANYAINEADLLLALGVRFDDRVTGKVSEFAKHGKIVHIDIDPSEINKNKAAHIPIVGDVGQALHDLVQMLDEQTAERHRAGMPLRRLDPPDRSTGARRSRCATPTATTPSCRSTPSTGCGRSSATASQLDDTIVTTGVGQHQMWAAQYCHFNTPAAPGSPAAAWGRWASACRRPSAPRRPIPAKTVIDIDGDGSFLMNIQELACAYCEKLPVKVLLLNNQHLGMVVQWEDRFYEGNRAHTYLGAGLDEEPYPDFVTLAKGFRCGARSIVAQGGPGRRPGRDARQQGAVRARRAGAVPGARAADDPQRHDGAGHHQGVRAGRRSMLQSVRGIFREGVALPSAHVERREDKKPSLLSWIHQQNRPCYRRCMPGLRTVRRGRAAPSKGTRVSKF